MSSTLVIQSQRLPLPADWLEPCLKSVRDWAAGLGYRYQFIDDSLFDLVPADLLEKTREQPVIATDLARLRAMQKALDQGYNTVIWCDSDFLIFAPDRFLMPSFEQLSENYALGREVWVQPVVDKANRYKAYVKVHNAFMLFRRGNQFLDFYAAQAERLLYKNQGSMPPQFIGPKLLTALHNLIQCPVIETAGVLSPAVIADLITENSQGLALKLLHQRSHEPMAAANLCYSVAESMKPGVSLGLEKPYREELLKEQSLTKPSSKPKNPSFVSLIDKLLADGRV